MTDKNGESRLRKLGKTVGSVAFAAGALLSTGSTSANSDWQRLLDMAKARTQISRPIEDPSQNPGQLVLTTSDGAGDVLAGHGSHSSHASHASHASHYSSSTGGGSSGTPVAPPVVRPKPVSPKPKPTTRPTSKPATRPASDPAEEPTTEPASGPAEEPATRPASDPAEEPTTEPASKPAEDPTNRPAASATEEIDPNASTIKMKDGRVFHGTIETKDGAYLVTVKYGIIRLAAADVESIVPPSKKD